jgi:PAS domain S-box-containing protein
MYNKRLIRQLHEHFGPMSQVPENYVPVFNVISKSYDDFEKEPDNVKTPDDQRFKELMELNHSLLLENNKLRKAAWDDNESEGLSIGILDSLSSLIAVIDARGTILKVNKSWNSFAINNGGGSLEKNGEGANYFDVCMSQIYGGDGTAANALEGIKSVLNGTLDAFYLEYPSPSVGKERWFYMRVVKFESEEPLVLIEHQLITERKQAEQELTITSQKLQHALRDINKIMDSSLDIICAVDEDGYFLQVSAACETIWGYRAEELIGKPLIDFVCPEDREKTDQAAANVKAGINMTHFENRYIRKDGSLVPIVWTARWDAKDKIRYGVARDATEKKRSEKAFEIERARFNELFLQAPSCIGILKGPTHIFEMANPLYLQLIGKEDIIGKTVKDVLPEAAEQGFVALLDEVYRTGQSFSANEMLIRIDKGGKGQLVDTYLNFIYQVYKNETGETEGIFFFAIEVTEQVLSRKKIEDSEKRHRQIVETAQEGIWLIDENNETTFVNRKMAEILEYSMEEMLGKKNYFFMDGESRVKAVENTVRRKLGMNDKYDFKFLTKSGKYVWTNLSTNPVFDDAGIYRGALAMVTDITETKNAADEIRESELRYRSLIEQATDAICIADASMKIIDINPSACLMLGYSKEEFMLLTIADLFLLEDLRENPFKLDDLQSGKVISNERRIKRKDGTIIEAEVNAKLLVDGGFIVFGRDISERKITERVIKASELRYRMLVEQASDAICIADSRMKFTDLNPYACQVLGYTMEEALKLSVYDIIFPEDLIANPIKFEEAKSADIIRNERRFKRKDGTSIVMEVSTRLMEDGGYIMFGHDVSERKKAEEVIQRSEASLALKNKELKLKNKELEHFAYVASHDLQEPLRTTSSFVDLLRQQYKGKLDERADKYLHYITESSDRMKVLITDLLDYSRIGNKKELKEVDCNTLLHEVLQDLGAVIKETGANIEVGSLPVISGYQTEMKQLFQNLVVNAIKFREKNTIPRISISADKDDVYWNFTVRDNGIGIEEDHKDRIFVIFQRLHTRTEYEGSGIGLAHCKKIVGLHGGEIWVESVPGEGASFHFKIPQTNNS